MEPYDSPFASLALLVQKKTGEVRTCVDYRALKKKTVKTPHPLPNTDDHYLKLYLSNGYYQVSMSEESNNKTAFITPDE